MVARLTVSPGRIQATVSGSAIVRTALTVQPWTVAERHAVTVTQNRCGSETLAAWMDQQQLWRLPFWHENTAAGGCSCGAPDICAHRVAVAEVFVHRLAGDCRLLLQLLNRGSRPLSRVAAQFYRGFRVPAEFGQGAERTHDEVLRVIETVRNAVAQAMDPKGGI